MKRRTLMSAPAVLLLPAAGSSVLDGAPASASPGGTGGLEPTTVESPALVHTNLPAFYEGLKRELTFPLAWGKSPIRDFRTWRRAARAVVEESLWQPVDRTRFRLEVVDEQPADGYVQRTILFNVTRHSRVRASLLVPDGEGPFPAALLLHDHGSKFDIGKEKLIRPWADPTRLASAEAWTTRYFSGRFVGNELAARGYVVLSVDAFGWGDRSGLAYDIQQAVASNFFNLGSSVAGLVAREDVRAAALLSTLPEVDSRRIAAVGFSMGAFRAWQVAALSDHVSAAVASCWMTTLADMMVPGNNTLRGQSAFFQSHPGLYRHLDIPDVASIAAPKPMLFFYGTNDPLFTPVGVANANAKMRAVWESRGHGDRLLTKVWPDLGHVFVDVMQEEAFAWLDHWLRR